MPGEFSNPSYVNPGVGGGGGTTAAAIVVASQSARLALLSGTALGRLVKQTSDSSVWCLKPNGVPAVSLDWELIGYYSLGTTTWAAISDKPLTFAPSAHKSSHATGGADALTPADIGASALGHTHTWAEIGGKPSTFTASAHKSSHATGGADALTPADIGASAVGHAHTWAEIGGKPSTYTASAHKSSHAIGGGDALTPADIGAAPLLSPSFTGTPAAPTAAPGTNTTQLATTAFVKALGDTKAPLESPGFTGTPAAPTAAPGTNTTQLASTAFVQAAVAVVAGGAIQFEGSDPNSLASISISQVTNYFGAVGPATIPFDSVGLDGRPRFTDNDAWSVEYLDGKWMVYHAMGYTAEKVTAAMSPVGLTDWTLILGFGQPSITSDSLVAGFIGQWCRVPTVNPEVFDWWQWNGAVWVFVRTDGVPPGDATSILAALASLSEGEITSLRAILESARVVLAP